MNCEGSGDDCFDPGEEPGAASARSRLARQSHVPDNYIKRVIQFAKQGYTDIDFPIYDTDWDSEAYLTVSGQNSNNSVRVTDEFLKAVETDGDWDLTWRTKHGKVAKTLKARELWEKIGYAAWASRRSRPAVPHHHQRLAHLPGVRRRSAPPIRARNTCSSTTPPAISPRSTCSRSATQTTRQFDVEGYEHAVRLWTVVLEISVMMAQFPSQGDRAAVLRVPHARPRLRQYRRPADVVGHSLRLRRRPRHRAARSPPS